MIGDIVPGTARPVDMGFVAVVDVLVVILCEGRSGDAVRILRTSEVTS